MTEKQIKEYLKLHLTEHRYEHSLLVAEEALKLAKIYNQDEEKAYLVGLGHDMAKYFGDEDNKYYIDKYNLSKDVMDASYRGVLHSDIGALASKEIFGFSDDMCEAIKYHTIGNPNMNLFDKIIFIADKIGRKDLDESLEKVRELTYAGNIDEALLEYFNRLKIVLEKRGLVMHKDSCNLIEVLQSNQKK